MIRESITFPSATPSNAVLQRPDTQPRKTQVVDVSHADSGPLQALVRWRGLKCFLINIKRGDHLKYRITEMNHSKNLSPHTAAIIPTDTTDMTPARKGIPPHNTRLPARTTPNMNLNSMVTASIISSHDALSNKYQSLCPMAKYA
jgi:hypothetical protein